MKTRELKAIIFDMDGVLVDSEPLHLLAMTRFLEQFGIEYSEKENQEFLGRKDLYIAQVLIDRCSLKMTARELVDGKEKILDEIMHSSSAARPGVYEILEAAKQASIPAAVASSATVQAIQTVMKILDIGKYFSAFTSGDEVEHSKPAPDIFLLAASKLGVAAENCLVIEDTLNGLKAAKAAGMYSISIPCDATAHQDHSIADLRLSSLEQVQLAELFARI
jgi:beta-phosphoglucomutase family hydrolase